MGAAGNEMGSIMGPWGGSKAGLGGKMVLRRPGEGPVLGSSSDSDTCGCVIFCSSLNLSEPQILHLIWELEGTVSLGRAVPWFTPVRVKCSGQCWPHCGGPVKGRCCRSLGAVPLAQYPYTSGRAEEGPERGSPGSRLLSGLQV